MRSRLISNFEVQIDPIEIEIELEIASKIEVCSFSLILLFLISNCSHISRPGFARCGAGTHGRGGIPRTARHLLVQHPRNPGREEETPDPRRDVFVLALRLLRGARYPAVSTAVRGLGHLLRPLDRGLVR